MVRWIRHSWLALLLLATLACQGAVIRPRLTPTPRPTRTPLPPAGDAPTITPLPYTPTPSPSPDWETVLPGMDVREFWFEPERISITIKATVVRLDPDRVDIRMHYQPRGPIKISEWQQATGAPLIINGGFFMTNKQTLGLLATDGQMFGTSFDRHGGMLSVSAGQVELRSLAQFPYIPGETFDQAIQGRPMLLYPGRFPVEFDLSEDLSRRTAVGVDTAGRVVFVVVDYGALSLLDLRDWLADEEELDLFAAFNLDGGGSTGMGLQTDSKQILIESFTALPIVIGVYPKP